MVRANPLVRSFPLREEDQAAWLESPNGLSATGRISIAWRTVKSEFCERGRSRLVVHSGFKISCNFEGVCCAPFVKS